MRSMAGLPFSLKEGMEVALVPPVLDAPRNVTVEFASADGLDGGTVYFHEVQDVDTAEMLVGCHCLILRSELPNEAMGYTAADAPEWGGWEAFDVAAGFIGTISGIKEMPGQIMMEIESPEDKTVLVPLVEAFIQDIDEDQRRLTFTLPAGLLDL